MSLEKALLVEKINEEHVALLAELACMVVDASNERLKPMALEEVARHWQGHVLTEEQAMKALGLRAAGHRPLHRSSHESITKSLGETAKRPSGKGLGALAAGIVDHILTMDMELIRLLKSE